MITGTSGTITGVTDYVDSTASTSTTSDGTIDTGTFTTLLLAQLQYQDPLNPMDSSQFSSQLAQFSSLEQLTNINTNLESMISSQDSGNKYQALDIIGKEIETDGDTLSLGDSGTAAGGFTIGSDADCAAVISDESGDVIRTINLGSLDAGDHSFTWDGKDQSGDAMDSGSYSFEIIAEGSTGESVTATTRIKGVVDRINLSTTDPTLYVGSLSIPLSEVTDINLAEN